MMSTICIRKYPNRRLYDTSRSTFITSGQLHDIVRNGSQIQVIETASGRDITNIVLMQAVIERDPARITSLPTDKIHNLVRGIACASCAPATAQ
jgi:polyhydroxyalkanoate synthesis repressor PhaR